MEKFLDISKSAITGLAWKTATGVFQVVSALLVQIILSRRLTPAEFGIYIYSLVFIGLSNQLAEAGTIPAIIQKKELTKKDLTISVLISILMGSLIWLLIWSIAPWITKSEIETQILRVLSVMIFFRSFFYTSEAILQRNFRFNLLFYIEFFSYLIGFGFISIFLSYNNCGPWSLVFAFLAQEFIRGLMLFFYSPVMISVDFSLSDFKPFLKFGVGMTLARLFNYVAGNISQFLIGILLSNYSLGLYQRAFQLIIAPCTRAIAIVSSVLFPFLSRVREEQELFTKTFMIVVEIVAMIVFPISVYVSITSYEWIFILFGEQWIESSKILVILSFGAAFISIFSLSDALARSVGAVYKQFRNHSLYALLVGLLAFIGSQISVEWTAGGFTIAALGMYVLNGFLASNITNRSFKDYLYSQKIGFLVSVVMIGIFLLLSYLGIYQWEEMPVGKALLIKSVFSLMGVIISIIIVPKKWYSDIVRFLAKNIRERKQYDFS